MNTYSINFLQDDWDGSGFDFSVAAVFQAKNINTQSIKNFIFKVSTMKDVFIKYISDHDPSKWQNVTKKETKIFLNSELDWEIIQLLDIDVVSEKGFKGYIELNQPDQVVVGGPSESYYTGNIESDYTIAVEIVEIIMFAVESFGEGYGCFGAGCNAVIEAEELRSVRIQPNLVIGLNSELINEISSK